MIKLSYEEIMARKRGRPLAARVPLAVILNDMRSLYNVGSIFRTADGVGAEKIWLTGITGRPPQSKISKTALGAEATVPWEHRQNAKEVIRELKEKNYQIVLVEQLEESVPHDEFEWKPPVCMVMGNENTGVSDELLSLADAAVDIEMSGLKHSLNVTVAFGIIAYHVKKQILSPKAGH